MAEDERRDFFVSFNQADRAWATWIAWVLEQGRYSVFFQDWDFRGSFIEQMHQATQRTQRTLVVLSDNYLNSEFARSEAWATLASDPVGRKDRVVTIKVGPTGDLGLLAHFAYLDLTAEGEAEAERLLCERARMSLEPGYRPKPANRPRFPGGAAKPAFPPPTPGPKVAVNNLPPINPDFVGREAVLAELRRLLLANQGPAVLTQAISGLGGIGKTQTARAYAYRHLADYDLIWWLRAETQATLAADYAALAEPLGLDPDTADQAKLIAAVRQRLQSGSGWLLILDNVEDPTLPREWLPRTGGGHALITSRRTDWRERAKVLSLELMPENEALQLLTGRSDPQALSPAELAAAHDLAAELGRLPLALAQARAYMAETGRSLAAYLRLFRASRPADFAADRPGPDYPASYATTWLLSIEAAEAACPGARPLLELLAFLAPEPLPVEILGADPNALPEVLRGERTRDDAVAALRRYSLVDLTTGQLRVHRLVQAVTLEVIEHTFAQARAEQVIGQLFAAVPRPSADHTKCSEVTVLLPHVLTAIRFGQKLNVSKRELGLLLNEIGLYQQARANLTEAKSLFESGIVIIEEIYGKHDPNFAVALNNLARCYWAMDAYEEAEPLYLQAIAIGEEAFASGYADTRGLSIHFAMWLNNLAMLYLNQQRYVEAEPLCVRSFCIRKQFLGPEHRDLAQSLSNLAEVYRATMRHVRAEPLCKRALKMRESTVGPEHPEVAQSLNNLAALDHHNGRHKLAEARYLRAKAIDEKAYGSDHPEVATDISNLASLYLDTHRYAEAEPLYLRAIDILEASLPPAHRRIAEVRANYAAFLARRDGSGAA